MAENEYLEPKRFDLIEINNGKKYKQGDGIQPDAINAPLEASSYILGLTDNIDISNIAGNGEPSVEIVENGGLPNFVFKNLKGDTGNGIQAVTLTEEKGLDFTMTDGTHLYTSSVQGENGAGFYITTSAISLAINSSITLSLSVIQYPANVTPKVNDIIFSISSMSNGYFGKITAINTTNSTCTVLTIANFANEINSLTLNVNGQSTVFDGSNPKTVNIDYSNENLLINPDFKINQRGSATYNGTASYTVDRWTFDAATYVNSPLSRNANSGMTLYNPLSSGYIVQYIEKPLELLTQYTLSANSPYGTLKTTFTTPSSLPTVTTNYSQLLAVVDSNGVTIGYIVVRYHATKGFWCVRIHNVAGEILTLNWIKLEKGAIATPFVTPEPTTELLKCQRYYYQTKTGNNYGVLSPVGWMQTTTQFRVLYELPTTLMKDPTVSIKGNVTVSFGSGTTKLTVTSTGKQHWHGDKQVLIITTSQGTKDATGCYLQANDDATAHIAFDAEI